MENRKKILIIAGAVLSLIVIIFIGILMFRKSPAPSPNPNSNQNSSIDCEKDPTNEACASLNKVDKTKEATLIMWGLFDDSTAFQSIIKEFNKQFPNVKVTYVKKQFADYEQLLVDSIASGSAPDIFIMENDWLPKHKAKISPAPSGTYSAEAFNNNFPKAAYDDLVADNKVYALPFYIDNLALFYNKKVFADNYIYNIPETWDEILAVSKTLTKKTPGNPKEITFSGIALGTSANVSRASDILATMMMQTNTPIISQDLRTFTFNQFRKDESGQPYYPGTNALDFYTSFAKPDRAAYSWNADFENNILAFGRGKTAMIIGYQYFAPQIEKENPKLSYGIARLPQIKTTSEERSTLTNYWAYTVSKDSKNKDLAWGFLKMALEQANLYNYSSSTGRPSPFKTARSDIFNQQSDIAKTFYKGSAEDLNKIFNEMIDDVIKYGQTTQSAVDTAARKANDMLSRYQ